MQRVLYATCSYKANARTIPPIMAMPPVAIFATAALVAAAADEDVELPPVEVAEVLVPVDAVLSVVDTGAWLAELVEFPLEEVETVLVDEGIDEVEVEVLDATEEV
jgi:hypothetical protein